MQAVTRIGTRNSRFASLKPFLITLTYNPLQLKRSMEAYARSLRETLLGHGKIRSLGQQLGHICMLTDTQDKNNRYSEIATGRGGGEEERHPNLFYIVLTISLSSSVSESRGILSHPSSEGSSASSSSNSPM